MSAFRSNILTTDLTDLFGIGCTLNPDGSVATITGPTWGRVTADPNGTVTANAGSLRSQNNGTLWINTTGGTVWVSLGGGGSGWNLPDNVSGIWGTTSPLRWSSTYVTASTRLEIVGNNVLNAAPTAGAGLLISTGSNTIQGAAVGTGSAAVLFLTGDTDSANGGGTGGPSGAILIRSGHCTSTLGLSGSSGSTTISTGNSDDANSGDVILTTGTAGGTRGFVKAQARLTTTDGVTGGTERIVGGLAYRTVASSTTVTNTTTETAFSTGVYTIPANTLKVGTQIHVRLWGTTPSTNAMDTLTIALRFGAAGVAAQIVTQTSAVDVANGDVFVVDVVISIRTAGTAGTMVASSQWVLGVPDTATGRADRMASAAINTTVARDLTATAKWSAASTADQAVLEGMSVWIY